MNLEELQLMYNAGKCPEFIYFWGPKNNYVEFSQWYTKAPFMIDSILYRTAEHYMMASKARLFGDLETEQAILKEPKPREVQKLGRHVKNFNQYIWNQRCFHIVVRGNLAKFNGSEYLKGKLLATEPGILIEASPYDKIWGVGLAEDNEQIKNPFTWKGTNLFGFALMEVRDKIKEKEDEIFI